MYCIQKVSVLLKKLEIRVCVCVLFLFCFFKRVLNKDCIPVSSVGCDRLSSNDAMHLSTDRC